MYQMHPDEPRQLYAELLQARENERMAIQMARARTGSPRSAQWPAFVRHVKHALSFSQVARG